MKKADIQAMFETLRAANPHPETELEYINPFTLLVAVVLSAQATDKGVNIATRKLFPVADTPTKMATLGEAGIRDYIKTIGLFNNKAKNIYALSVILRDEHQSKVPDTIEGLMALPGVGRKTANVVMNVVYGAQTMAVDTHVFRVANRTGLAPGKTPEEVEVGLLRVIPAEFLTDAHHWLILHGRYTCVARNPKCGECGIKKQCAYFKKQKLVLPG